MQITQQIRNCGWVVAGSVAMGLLVCQPSRADETTKHVPPGKAVPFKRMDAYKYHNFVKNWAGKYPVLFALIRTPTDYDKVFHPAPTNGDRGPFAPEKELYRDDQLLLVSRVSASIEPGIYTVKSLTVQNDTLTLRYSFKDSGSEAMFKSMLQLRIPKHTYKRIILIENGKQICKLNVADGQWAVPPARD